MIGFLAPPRYSEDNWLNSDNLDYFVHRLITEICRPRNPVLRTGARPGWVYPEAKAVDYFCNVYGNRYLHEPLTDYADVIYQARRLLPREITDVIHVAARWRDVHDGLSDDTLFADEMNADLQLAFEAMIEVGAIQEAYRFIRS